MTKEEARNILSEWIEPVDNKTVSSNDLAEAIELLLEETDFADQLARLREQERKAKLPELIDFWWMQEDKNGKRLIEMREHFAFAMKKAYNVGLNQQQPSLPSNIDEAAEEFGKRQGIELAPFAKKFFKSGAEWMAQQGWKEISESDYPKPNNDKLYCVFTKGHYLLATVILHPNDDALCQWRCTDFPHHRYDICVGDSYIEIRKNSNYDNKRVINS